MFIYLPLKRKDHKYFYFLVKCRVDVDGINTTLVVLYLVLGFRFN